MKDVQSQMNCELKAENRLNDIMKPDEVVDIFELMPRMESEIRLDESHNYCYNIVFQELNEANLESES